MTLHATRLTLRHGERAGVQFALPDQIDGSGIRTGRLPNAGCAPERAPSTRSLPARYRPVAGCLHDTVEG